MTVILQTLKKGEKPTRTEYPNWLDAMNDGSVMMLEDNDVTVAIFLKGEECDFE